MNHLFHSFHNRGAHLFLVVVSYLIVGCSAVNPRLDNTQPPEAGMATETANNLTLPAQTPSPMASLIQDIPSTPTEHALPTDTSTVAPIEPLGMDDLGTIYKIFPEAYSWSNLMLLESELQVDEGPHNTLTRSQSPNSPANSQLYAFSHYSDQIAYWTQTDPSEFWVTDVAYEQPQQVFVDTEGVYVPRGSLPTEHLQQMRWSPDDRHLIIYTLSETKPHLIYHLETRELQEWYWLCQEVVVSPRTDQLAVSCTVDNRFDAIPKDTYAIIEWQGDIWFTDEQPNVILSRALPDGTIPWRFSADGQKVAYFDPVDPGHHLLIADAKGNVQQLLPGSSLLQPDQRITAFEAQYYESSPVRDIGFFRWSRNGERILAHVLGNLERPCRPLRDSENGFYESPCWQVIEVATGQVLWTDIDTGEILFRDEFERSNMYLVQAEFSPDGKMIAIHGQHFGDHLLAVIDLNTSTVYRLFPLPLLQIYWASAID